MRQIDFPSASIEFCDRTGMIRTAYECSILGRDEFFQRLEKLTEIISQANSSSTIAQLYQGDKWFRHNCNRCLELCNIDPEWLNEAMLTGLLFGNGNQLAALVELNLSTNATQPKPNAKPATTADMLAVLWELTGNLGDASAIASNVPTSVIDDVLKSRSELHQSPDEKRKADIQRWAQQSTTDTQKAIDLTQILSEKELAFRGG